MDSEKEKSSQPVRDTVHKDLFTVIKIPLRDTGHESAYEWIPSGNGRLKRVPKIPKVDKPQNLASLNH